MNAPSRYSDRIIWIHWVSTLLILALIYLGVNMEHAPVDARKILFYRLHFSIGILVFLLTLWRVVALFRDPRPAPLAGIRKLHRALIVFVQKGFYLLIILMCITGIAGIFTEGITAAVRSGDPGDLPQPTYSAPFLAHHILAKFVFLLLLLHVGGFTLHLVRRRQNTLERIWVN